MIDLLYNLCYLAFISSVFLAVGGLLIPNLGDWLIRVYNLSRFVKPDYDHHPQGLSDRNEGGL